MIEAEAATGSLESAWRELERAGAAEKVRDVLAACLRDLESMRPGDEEAAAPRGCCGDGCVTPATCAGAENQAEEFEAVTAAYPRSMEN